MTAKNPKLVYNRNMSTKKVLKYTVIFETAKEGGYVAYVPLLPGCITQGETYEEAKINVKDAIKGYLKVLKEDKDPIPVENEKRISISTVVVPVLK